MPDIERLKERILNENYSPDDFIYKLLDKPLVATTAEYAIPDEPLGYRNGVVIEQWEMLQLVLVLFISFLGAVTIHVTTKIHFLIAFPVLFVILYLIYKNVKAFHRQVIIDTGGITIKKERFEWPDIVQTFILDENPEKRNKHPSASFLVIVDNIDKIERFEISYLSTTPKMLATIIEYFKAKANT